MSYRNLEIWQMARSLVVDVHQMTLAELPKFETFEEGSQIRRAIKSVKSNIVEGYGRRKYRRDYVRFLVYAHASCDEAKDHLETLAETGSLRNHDLYRDLHGRIEKLSKALNGFTTSVASEISSVREEDFPYPTDSKQIAHCNLRLETCNLRPVTCYLLPATCDP